MVGTVNFDFLICDVPMRLQTDRPLPIQSSAVQFLKPGEPLFTVVCRVGEIRQIQGSHVADKRDGAVFRNNETVIRCLTAGSRYPAVLAYEIGQLNTAELTVEEQDWQWALDDLRLWSTIAIGQLLLPMRVLLFHASYVNIGGRAVLFTAPSGTGKSTQAELWRKYRGAQVINGDKAGISLGQSPMAHGVPFSGTSGICHNTSLPLEAVVVLSQAKENTIRQLRPGEAVAALSPNIFADHTIPEERQMVFHLMLDLVSEVPVYALACTPDEQAVKTLESVLNM